MTEIRALTVRQPWAWAILHCGKDVEYRTRNVAGSYRGPVAIHASKTPDEWAANPRYGDSVLLDASDAAGLVFRWQNENDFPRGAIIGVVDLVDSHRSSWCGPECNQDKLCSHWAHAFSQHLVFADPRPLPMPVPWKGRLGLWRIDPATVPGLEDLCYG